MKQTYTGSCHCGAIRYQAELDLSAGSARCNCRYCSKIRYWGIMAKPAEFKILAGEADLQDYTRHEAMHHRFCRHCGANPFGHGNIPEIGGEFVSVNIACLDGLSAEQLAEIPIKYSDGLNDNWWNPPAITKHL
ncbi:MAG: GFA family protein [Candidatus Sericytochromatia bacterium]